MIKLQLMLIYDTDFVTSRLFRRSFNCRYRKEPNIVSSLKQQSRTDMSSHSNTLSWFCANQSLLFPLNAASLKERQQLLWSFYGLYTFVPECKQQLRNNTRRYEILHTLNLGCNCITLREPWLLALLKPN
jgi:hypothetical protein